jgi:hypothetical protein
MKKNTFTNTLLILLLIFAVIITFALLRNNETVRYVQEPVAETVPEPAPTPTPTPTPAPSPSPVVSVNPFVFQEGSRYRLSFNEGDLFSWGVYCGVGVFPYSTDEMELFTVDSEGCPGEVNDTIGFARDTLVVKLKDTTGDDQLEKLNAKYGVETQELNTFVATPIRYISTPDMNAYALAQIYWETGLFDFVEMSIQSITAND